MARQKLTERNAATTAPEGSYVHVVVNGVSKKITKANFQKNLSSGIVGGISSSSAAPTSDGLYICEDSGTYSNYGSIVVDLTSTLTFIVVTGTQTVFDKIEIPISTLGYQIITSESDLISATAGDWIIINDFTLTANRTLPSGVTLHFNGGVIDLDTYILTGDETKIDADLIQIFDASSGSFAGTFDLKQVFPEWFGATGDGATDDLTFLQSTEDFCDDIGGYKTIVFNKTYAISSFVTKKSNIDWIGTGGEIFKKDYATLTGVSSAIIFADGVTNFKIKDLILRNVTRDRELSSMTSTSDLGDANTIIDVHNCTKFEISGNLMERFAQGVIYRSCEDFIIKNNKLYASNTKTIAGILAGTHTNFGSYAFTGGINCGWVLSDNDTPSSNFVIDGNIIEAAGLDVGIDGLSQTYTDQPCVITNNIIRGVNCGIQVYRGTFLDDGTADTYAGNVVVSSNDVYATVEQGIYVRGVVGVTVVNNQLRRCGAMGANGDSSAGSIMFRVNPFTAGGNFVSATAGDVYDDHPSICSNNRIVNHGSSSVANDAALSIEINNVKVIGNIITRSEDVFTADQDTIAIYIGNGKKLRTVEVRDNTIQGLFEYGIFYTDVVKSAGYDDYCIIKGNTLHGTFDNGINIQSFTLNNVINNNILSGTYATYGVFIKNSPITTINDNDINNAGTAINIASGCLLSDVNYFISAGSVSKNNRRGSLLDVSRNILTDCTNTFAVTETNGSDAYFDSRCSNFEDNYVNNVKQYLEFSGGTARSTFTARTWTKHDRVLNSNLSTGQVEYKICSASGQYGSSTTATGTTSSGSPIITSVSDMDGLGIGIYITTPNFTGVLKIIDVDTSASTITVDSNANSTGSSQTLTPSSPSFVSPATIT